MTRQTNSPSTGQDDRRQFASDNYAGICPEAWEALVAANKSHAPAYGDDSLTERASDALRELFETDCEIFFVASGTAANALALASLCQSYQSIICHELAHIETDECGAPEFFSNGTKLLVVEGAGGKVRPEVVEELARKRCDLHFPQPRAVSISQATELGTVYQIGELCTLGETCRRLGLKLHMDGARFANAVAALDVAPKEITWQAGVDVLSLGGAKNGLALGEAVVFFDRALADGFEFRCKQAGHLLSKLRFIAAPWVGLLESGAWLRNAQHANRMATLLRDKLEGNPAIEIMLPTEANSVFVCLAPAHRDALRDRGWRFYDFIGAGGARLMCSWDTTEADIAALAADIRAITRG
jgi:threonine aldolase